MTQGIEQKMTPLEVEIAEAIKKIAEAIRSGDIKITEAENRFKVLSLAGPGPKGGEALDKANALDQIEQELKALRESRELFVALLAKTKDRCGISNTNIRVSDNGEILVGGNHAGGNADARVVINNVEATSGGKCIVGIVEGISLDDFFN